MKRKLLFNVLLASALIVGIVIGLWEDETIFTFLLDDDDNTGLKEINVTNDVINDAIKQYNNNDIKAKLTIEGTNINGYVVQTTNNDYYLNHSISKEEDKFGAIFMDYRNSFFDRNIIIYGHNSKSLSNAPFYELKKFMNKDFYYSHGTIKLETENAFSVWKIFSVMITKKDETRHLKINFNDSEWQNYIKWVINNSIYTTDINIEKNSVILTLQTCYYEPDDSFLIISATKYNGG